MIQNNLKIDWVDDSPKDSIADVKNAEFSLNLTGNGSWLLNNPLGTEFDIAQIWIDNANEELDCSPFIEIWDQDDIQQFKDLKGLWLFSTNKNLILQEGLGDKKTIADQPQWGLFFVLSDKINLPTSTKIKLSVCCNN